MKRKSLLMIGAAAITLLISLVAYQAGKAQVPIATLEYFRVATVNEPVNNAFIVFDHGIAATKDQLMTVANPNITINDPAIMSLEYQLRSGDQILTNLTYSTWNEARQPRLINDQINFKPVRFTIPLASLKKLEVIITVTRSTESLDGSFASSYPQNSAKQSGDTSIHTFTYPVKISRYYSQQ